MARSNWAQEAGWAVGKNLLPGVVLWLLASAVVGVYYLVPTARPAFDGLAHLKTTGGFLFSAISTAMFAGLIPFLFRRGSWAEGLFLVGFWAWRGLEVDAFYQLQAWFFGSSGTWSSIAAKVSVDMLVYNVFWATHLQLLAYRWKDSGFRGDVLKTVDWSDYWRRSFPVALISTWVVWVPVVTLIYCLPGSLQIPLFNLAACFWAFVVMTLTRD